MDVLLSWLLGIIEVSAVILAAVSLYFFSKIIWLGIRKIISKGWPVTTGRVIAKDVAAKFSEAIQVPQVRYTYSVMGVEYKRQISLESKSDVPYAEKVLDDIGDTLIVRYNPNHPRQHITALEKVRLDDIGGIVIPFVAWLYLIYTIGSFFGG